jgi:hypothetical protein
VDGWMDLLGLYDSVPTSLPFRGDMICMSFIHLRNSHAKGILQLQDSRVRNDGPCEPAPTAVTRVTVASAFC